MSQGHPMLEEVEWERVQPLLSFDEEATKRLCAATGLPLREALSQLQSRALAEYRRITGFDESNHQALYHHRIALHGPPCAACGKPLRTPAATMCAACGAASQAE